MTSEAAHSKKLTIQYIMVEKIPRMNAFHTSGKMMWGDVSAHCNLGQAVTMPRFTVRGKLYYEKDISKFLFLVISKK